MLENMVDIALVTQTLGWLASLCGICSYACKDFHSVRIVNLVSCIFFVAYGALLGAPAIIIGNGTIGLIHMAYLVSHNRFGDVVKRHFAITWILYAAYAAVMVCWTASQVVFDGSNAAEIVGTISAVGLVAGFLMSDEKKMRWICSAFTVGYIAYAILIASAQMAIMNGFALAVNIWRMMTSAKSVARPDGKGKQ